MDIGKHCDTCGHLDFLPFECRKCSKVLCGEHRVHDCIEDPPTPIKPLPTKSLPQKQKPADKPAARPAAIPVEPAKKPEKPKQLGQKPSGNKPGNERALAALERFRVLVGYSARSKAKSAGVALSPEMCRSAVGDPNIPVANRMYFKVQRPPQPYTDPITNTIGTRPAKTVVMYFDKTLTAGQLLDWAAKRLGFNAKTLKCEQESISLSSPVSGLVQGTTLVVS